MSTELQPRGTLRARIDGGGQSDALRRLRLGARSCDLGDEGLYLAEELVAADRWLGGADPLTLGVLVLALMIAQRQGSTRLPLAAARGGVLWDLVASVTRLAGIEGETPRLVKAIAKLTGAPQFQSVIGTGAERRPLVVDDACLYTERARWLEDRVAARLAARLAAPGPRDARAVDAVMAELAAAPAGRPLTDEQAAAVRLALSGSLTVITGGPGTGKTVVAAALVRGFARLHVASHVALAAQTGKAANRLTQAISEQLRELAAPGAVDAALAASPPAAQTLHRLLGYRGGRFAHHAQSPLPVGAVIIDEASMIDLELMDALLDALPPHAPLVLVGDAHQLPAIDAGQILADLAAEGSPASARVAILAQSFRMDPGDPDGRAVLAAAAAVHSGDAGKLVERKAPLAHARTPGALQFRGVEYVDTSPRGGADPQAVVHQVVEGLWHHAEGPKALRAGDRVFEFRDGHAANPAELEALWALLGHARILTVTRALPTGAIALNAHLHDLALDRMSVAGRPDFAPGEPVMITANDYTRGLFNGDQGMIVRADEGLGRHHFRAVFRCGGELRPFAIEALRDRLELSWALTVHKAQGSELDAIALVLPHDDLPLVTRELIYTGLTRARRGVAIAAPRDVLLAGAKRSALRHSGLGHRLRARLP